MQEGIHSRHALGQVSSVRNSVVNSSIEFLFIITQDLHLDLFRLRSCEKITKKIMFLVHFYTLFPNIYFLFGRNEKLCAFIVLYFLAFLFVLQKLFHCNGCIKHTVANLTSLGNLFALTKKERKVIHFSFETKKCYQFNGINDNETIGN